MIPLLLAAVTIVVASIPVPAKAGVQAGGCYLPLDQGVVMGLNRKRQTVQLPIGRLEQGESLKETAARETREETGINVDVGARLVTLREGTVAIFYCSPKDPVSDLSMLKPVDTREVQEVLVLDPHTLRNFDDRHINNPWRHPPLKFMLRLLFTKKPSPRND